MSPTPQTSNWSGIFFAVSYSKLALTEMWLYSMWKCKCKLELWLSFLDNFYGVWPIVVHTVGGAMLFQVETQGREWEARKAFPLLHTQQTAVLPNWRLGAKMATFVPFFYMWVLNILVWSKNFRLEQNVLNNEHGSKNKIRSERSFFLSDPKLLWTGSNIGPTQNLL